MRRTRANAEQDASGEVWLRDFWALCVEVGIPPGRTFDADARHVRQRLSRARLREVQKMLEPLAQMLPEDVRPRAGALVSPATARVVVAALYPLMGLVVSHMQMRLLVERQPTLKKSIDARVSPMAGELRIKMDQHGNLSLVEKLTPAAALARLVAQVVVERAHLYQVCRNPKCGRVFFKVSRQKWCDNKCRDRFRKANERRPNRKRLEPAPPLRLLTDDEVIEGTTRRE